MSDTTQPGSPLEPKDLEGMVLEKQQFILDEHNAHIVAWLLQYWQRRSPPDHGFILRGPTGVGKTMAIRVTIEAVRRNNPVTVSRGPGDPVGCFRWHWTNTDLKLVCAATAFDSLDRPEQIVPVFTSETGILVVDDLGVEMWPYGQPCLANAIYARYEKGLTTCITTNLTRLEVRQRYGDNVGDRLEDVKRFVPLILGTESRRPKKTSEGVGLGGPETP